MRDYGKMMQPPADATHCGGYPVNPPASEPSLDEWEKLANAATEGRSRQRTASSADFDDALAESNIARERLASVSFEAIPALIAMVREKDTRADAWKDQALEWESRATAAESDAAAARKRVRELEAENIEREAELIYLRMYGKDGAVWHANHSKDVWREKARAALGRAET
jgi:hypothetical protein